MTPADIDHDLDALAEHARACGVEDDGPGLILLSSTTWCRPGFALGHETTNIIRGIRYRGVRIFISSKYEDRVLTRKEAMAHGPGAFEPLTPKGPDSPG